METNTSSEETEVTSSTTTTTCTLSSLLQPLKNSCRVSPCLIISLRIPLSSHPPTNHLCHRANRKDLKTTTLKKPKCSTLKTTTIRVRSTSNLRTISSTSSTNQTRSISMKLNSTATRPKPPQQQPSKPIRLTSEKSEVQKYSCLLNYSLSCHPQ